MSRPTSAESDGATPAMVENTPLPFLLPSVRRKKVTAAFDGGLITSDGGVLLLSAIETKIGIADRLAPSRTPSFPLVAHSRDTHSRDSPRLRRTIPSSSTGRDPWPRRTAPALG